MGVFVISNGLLYLYVAFLRLVGNMVVIEESLLEKKVNQFEGHILDGQPSTSPDIVPYMMLCRLYTVAHVRSLDYIHYFLVLH